MEEITTIEMPESLKPHLKSYEKKINRLKNVVKSMIYSDKIPALIVSGPPGIGKTYNVINQLDSLIEKNQDFSYNTSKGRISPIELFNKLQINRHKNVVSVFDDCDSIFADKDALNCLKAASDTIPERIITWNVGSSKSKVKEFIFNGKILIMTNCKLAKNPHLRAVIDRFQYFDMQVTNEEKIAKIVDLGRQYSKSSDVDNARTVIKFILKNMANIDEDRLSLRMFIKLMGLIESFGKEEFEDYAFTMGIMNNDNQL